MVLNSDITGDDISFNATFHKNVYFTLNITFKISNNGPTNYNHMI